MPEIRKLLREAGIDPEALGIKAIVPDAWKITQEPDDTVVIDVYEVEDTSPLDDKRLRKYFDLEQALDFYSEEFVLRLFVIEKRLGPQPRQIDLWQAAWGNEEQEAREARESDR